MNSLSISQKKFIQSTVHVVEEKIRNMEALVIYANQHREKGIQVTLEYDLQADELDTFQQTVKEIKALLLKISQTYNLEPEQISLKHLVSTKAAFIWEDITGAGFDRLKGHGAIDEGYRKEYESLFNKLTKLADELIGHS